MSRLVLSFFAGNLSVLSPCVLPMLPIVVASALQRHPHGPLALAAGVVVSSTAAGLFFASFAFVIDVDREIARSASGAFMAAVGIALLVPPLQGVFTRALAPVAEGAGGLATRVPAKLAGQFVLGALLGAVWTPCTGPTLAAAVTLAARSESVTHAGAVMLTFGIGAVVPLLAFAYGSRRTLAARGRELRLVGTIGKPVMGVALLMVGALAMSGADKIVETWVVDHMPEWLVTLTTRL